MFGELDLVRSHDFLIFLDPSCPRTHIVGETNVYCLLGSGRVLSFFWALLVEIDQSSAAESPEIAFLTIHGLVLCHPYPFLECHVSGILACRSCLEPNLPPRPDSAITGTV